MVNLTLYRYYEVLKKGSTSVRFSLTILAALAATILLFYRMDLFTDKLPVVLNKDLIVTLSISAFVLIVLSVGLGFLMSDSESGGAQKAINDYFLKSSNINSAIQNFPTPTPNPTPTPTPTPNPPPTPPPPPPPPHPPKSIAPAFALCESLSTDEIQAWH